MVLGPGVQSNLHVIESYTTCIQFNEIALDQIKRKLNATTKKLK